MGPNGAVAAATPSAKAASTTGRRKAIAGAGIGALSFTLRQSDANRAGPTMVGCPDMGLGVVGRLAGGETEVKPTARVVQAVRTMSIVKSSYMYL